MDKEKQIKKELHTDAGNRIEWVDFAKGVAMLLVIVAHTMESGRFGGMTRGMIYSFHMPLFFIVSGLTMKPSATITQFFGKTKKAAKGLLLPGVFLYAAWVVIELLRGLGSVSDVEFWKGKLLTLLFASACSTSWGETFIAGIGMIWFFFVFFGGKVLFDFLHLFFNKKQILIAGIFCGIGGIILGFLRWLPFSFDVALAVLPFFVFGEWMKEYKLQEKTVEKCVIWFVVWAVCLCLTYPHYEDWTYLEVGLRRYSIVPVSYIGACAGTMLVGGLGILCMRHMGTFGEKLAVPFCFVGKHSFYLLCIHIMDQLWDFVWYTEGVQFLSAAKRLGTNLVVFAVLMLGLKLFYRLRTSSPSRETSG